MSRCIDNELIALQHCTRCRSENLTIEDCALVCGVCGHKRAIDEHGILRESSMDVFNPSSLDEQRTKGKYQSADYALRYMQAYASPRTLSDLYAVFAARQERRAVEQALRLVPPPLQLVLDLPAGTGKLAPVHEKFAYRVIAADASADMLRTGLGMWKNGDQLAALVQTDVRRTGFRSNSIDCTVCLRLMHRLPADLANEALRELARITKRALIVSTRINLRTLSSIRKSPRAHGVAPLDLIEWNRRLAAIGEVQRTLFVARGVSQEVVSLVDVSEPTTSSSLDEASFADALHRVNS